MIQSIDKAKQTKSLIEDLRDLVKDDWMLMDQEIEQQLSSDIGLINSISVSYTHLTLPTILLV